MHKISVYILPILMLTSLYACAQTRKTTAGASGIQVLSATQQTTQPGRPEGKPSTEFRFKIVWMSKSSPSAFFWRPSANDWQDLSVTKPMKRPGLGPNDFMIVQRNIELKNIRYGDTLTLVTHHHAHNDDPMPAAVKKLPISSLYYQTAATGAKWMFTTAQVRVLPNIVLP